MSHHACFEVESYFQNYLGEYLLRPTTSRLSVAWWAESLMLFSLLLVLVRPVSARKLSISYSQCLPSRSQRFPVSTWTPICNLMTIIAGDLCIRHRHLVSHYFSIVRSPFYNRGGFGKSFSKDPDHAMILLLCEFLQTSIVVILYCVYWRVTNVCNQWIIVHYLLIDQQTLYSR